MCIFILKRKKEWTLTTQPQNLSREIKGDAKKEALVKVVCQATELEKEIMEMQN
jgi:hypothetical protein